MTGLDKSNDIAANKGPLVTFCEKSVCGVKSVVFNIIVCGLHSFGLLFLEEYPLVCILWVIFPKCAIFYKESCGIVGNDEIFTVRDVRWMLEGDKPLVGHYKSLVC